MAAAASRQSARRFRRGCIECGHHRSDTDIRRARQTTVVDHPSFPRLPRRKTLQSTGTRSRSEPLESGRTSCRVARRAPSLALRDDGHLGAKNSDTSHGVRCLSTKSASRIVGAPTCLTGAIRSQGFSPSQRFDPLETSWLCFTPHPSAGFRASRAFPAQPAAAPLDAQCSPAVQVSAATRTEVRSAARGAAASEPSSG
jgi:hypothetical protein